MTITTLLLIAGAYAAGRHVGRNPEAIPQLKAEAISLAADLQRALQLLLQLAAAVYAAGIVCRQFVDRHRQPSSSSAPTVAPTHTEEPTSEAAPEGAAPTRRRTTTVRRPDRPYRGFRPATDL